MADADTKSTVPKTWADVAHTALHYVAAGALLGAIGYFATKDATLVPMFTNLCVIGLTSLGVYQGTRP